MILVKIVAQLLLYLLFIVGALVEGTIVYFIIFLTSPDKNTRKLRLRKVVKVSFKVFIYLGTFFRLYKVTFKDLATIKELHNVIVVANHPTLLDYVILTSVLDVQICTMVKKDLTKGFMSSIIKHLGYIPNNSGIDVLKQELLDNRGLLIFPEGSRTKDYQNLKFMRGAARVALETGLVIVPVFIKVSDRTSLAKGFFAFLPPKKLLKYEIEVGKAIDIHKYYSKYPTKAIMARYLTGDLENMYSQYLHK